MNGDPAELDTSGWDWGPELSDDDDFWESSATLTHIRTYARAYRCAPWAMLGVILARIATATPPNVVLPALIGDYGSLNMFVGLTAHSGGGKSAAMAAARGAVHTAGVRAIGLGSGEGLAHQYMRRDRDEIKQHTQAVMFTMDEIEILGALTGRRAGTLGPQLRTAWTGAELGFAYADPDKRLPVPAHKYRLTLVSGIQFAKAGVILDDADAGTPQRFLWLPLEDPTSPETLPDRPGRREWDLPLDLRAPDGETMVIEVCSAAARTIDVQRVAVLRGNPVHPDTGEPLDPLDSHSLFCRLKTGALLALLDGNAHVTDHYWELAGEVMRRSDAVRASAVKEVANARKNETTRQAHVHAAEAVIIDEERAKASRKRVKAGVRRHIAKTGSDGIVHGKLRKKFSGDDRGYADDATEELLTENVIVGLPVDNVQDGTGGGTSVRYVLARYHSK